MCLYNFPRRIDNYFRKLNIPEEKVTVLHYRYYVDYGLAIRGLVKHHEVDPADYDREVDGGLPLEDLLKPDPELRVMLESLKMRKWIVTNAGLAHARRVLRILQIEDQFEGITYCDYTEPNFICKPEEEFYFKAMKEAGISDVSKCYFVDDSAANVDTGYKLGWTSVHVADNPQMSNFGHFQIANVKELPLVLPELWKID
ncbi:HAD-like domain-containing protein [Endogone sp. FLAS-F59071]|nr:HAD-like domain-containing protein [Endogone sp. FLAS-F59071]|eukprot:RUS23380.1 HAD-like domain-containing protein [Endogone sp. FLAS-F59071]